MQANDCIKFIIRPLCCIMTIMMCVCLCSCQNAPADENSNDVAALSKDKSIASATYGEYSIYGATVENGESVKYPAELSSMFKRDVIIFTVGGEKSAVIRPNNGSITLPVEIEFSACGYTEYDNELKISSVPYIDNIDSYYGTNDTGMKHRILGGSYEIEIGNTIKKINYRIEFEMGVEGEWEENGAFRLEPDKRYIACVELSRATQYNDADGNPIGDIAINGITINNNTYYSIPYAEMPIAEYSDDFFETRSGKYFSSIIEAYGANANSLSALAVNGSTAAIECFVNANVWISKGRDISEDEYASGAKLCIVSEMMAKENGWNIGDKLQLAFYETENETVQKKTQLYEKNGGYIARDEYEIVGFYSGNVRQHEEMTGYDNDEWLSAWNIIVPALDE